MNEGSLILRKRKVRKRPSSQRSDCWLEREEGDWDAFPPPKIFHLSYQPPTGNPLYLGGQSGFENHGYQRWGHNLPDSIRDEREMEFNEN